MFVGLSPLPSPQGEAKDIPLNMNLQYEYMKLK